jgi:hypothetical protein
MNSTRTAPQAIKVAKSWHNDDRQVATLTPVHDEQQGITVHLVQVDEYTANHYGARDVDGTLLADRTLGGIVRGSDGKWTVIAYFSREDFLTDPRAFHAFLEVGASSRAHAVRMLLRFYWVRMRNAQGHDVALTNADYRKS